MIADRRLYETRDGRVVEEDDPHAATLLVGAGSVLSDSRAQELGITSVDGRLQLPTPPQPHRRQYVVVTAVALVALLAAHDGQRTFAVEGLPPDAEVIDCQCDRGDRFRIILESESFPEVAPGAAYPELLLSVREIERAAVRESPVAAEGGHVASPGADHAPAPGSEPAAPTEPQENSTPVIEPAAPIEPAEKPTDAPAETAG